jgi:hypothetical protein
MRAPQPDVPPLFRSDPEENFSLWMQNCFPDASLAREDAIREWLTKPLEACVQRNNNHPAEITAFPALKCLQPHRRQQEQEMVDIRTRPAPESRMVGCDGTRICQIVARMTHWQIALPCSYETIPERS